MTTNEPPPYPGDPGPGENPPPYGSGDSPTSGLPSYGSTPPPEGSAPPPPPPPPGAPGGSDEAFSPGAAIGWGWGMFKKNAGPLILATVILLVVSFALGMLGSLIGPSDSGLLDPTATSFELDGGDVFWSIVTTVLISAVTFVVTTAISRASLDLADGGEFDIGGAFGKVDVGTALITGLLVGLLTQIGFMLLVVPGILVAFFTYFTSYYVAEGASPVESIKKSFSLVGANVGNALVLAILCILVLILGVLALCVGLLVAIPVTFLASAYAFRRFQGQPVQPVPAA